MLSDVILFALILVGGAIAISAIARGFAIGFNKKGRQYRLTLTPISKNKRVVRRHEKQLRTKARTPV